jgi:hypothetical protein
MLDGAHIIIYSTDAEADRAFLRDVLALPGVDVGDGWLIFALPPAEVAVHPASVGGSHELYLMCPDVEKLVAGLGGRGVACDPVTDQGWGLVTGFTLPGGGKLGVYEPRHARPAWPAAKPVRSAARAARPARPARPTRRPATRARPEAGRRTTRARPKAGRRATKRK